MGLSHLRIKANLRGHIKYCCLVVSGFRETFPFWSAFFFSVSRSWYCLELTPCRIIYNILPRSIRVMATTFLDTKVWSKEAIAWKEEPGTWKVKEEDNLGEIYLDPDPAQFLAAAPSRHVSSCSASWDPFSTPSCLWGSVSNNESGATEFLEFLWSLHTEPSRWSCGFLESSD